MSYYNGGWKRKTGAKMIYFCICLIRALRNGSTLIRDTHTERERERLRYWERERDGQSCEIGRQEIRRPERKVERLLTGAGLQRKWCCVSRQGEPLRQPANTLTLVHWRAINGQADLLISLVPRRFRVHSLHSVQLLILFLSPVD